MKIAVLGGGNGSFAAAGDGTYRAEQRGKALSLALDGAWLVLRTRLEAEKNVSRVTTTAMPQSYDLIVKTLENAPHERDRRRHQDAFTHILERIRAVSYVRFDAIAFAGDCHV